MMTVTFLQLASVVALAVIMGWLVGIVQATRGRMW